MSARRRSAVLRLGGTMVSAIGAASALRAVERRWRTAHDPCSPDGVCLPPSTEFEVRTSDGAILAGCVTGDGPPVLLVHCWTGCRDLWGPVARRLVASGHRVVLYDHRGHGRSTLGDEGCSVARIGRDLGEVIDELDLREVVVAGHSMGGMAAQAFAIDAPEACSARVAGLVLVATTSHGVFPVGRGRNMPMLGGRVDALLRTRVGLAAMRSAVGRNPVYAHLVATRDSFVATPGPVRTAFLRAMQEMDLRAGLERVEIPAAVVVGTRDALVSPRLGRSLAERLPDARLVEIPDAGHMLPLEAPDVLAEVIAELATTGARPLR